MMDPSERSKVPWGAILTVAALVTAIVAVFRLTFGLDDAASWPAILSAAGMGIAAFFTLRWLQNYGWGLLAGVLLPLHPLVRAAAQPFSATLFGEALDLTVLAAVVGAWTLAFFSRFALRSWLFAVLVLGQGVGLAWCVDPRAGLVASVVTTFGMVLAAFLAAILHRRGRVDTPSWGNVGLAVLLGVGIPVAGLFLGPPVFRAFGGRPNPGLIGGWDAMNLLQAGLGGPIGEYRLHGFAWSELERWAWPEIWVVLPLTAWGFIRSIWRGSKLWSRRKAPTAWMLTLYAVVSFTSVCLHAGPAEASRYLALGALAVLLSIYGIADLVRGFLDKLVLAPPQERD